MKYLSIIKYVALAIGALSVLLLPIMGDASVSIMLNWMYVLLFATIAVTLILPAINLIKDPKAAVSSLIGFLFVAVVLVISFVFASADPIPNSAGGFFDNWLELKLSDTGIYATYIALAISVIFIVFGEIRNSFK